MANRGDWHHAQSANRWPRDDGSDSESSDDDVEARAQHDPELASQMLTEYLLTLFFAGRLSAKSVCVLCFWAKAAGCKSNEVAQFAMKPSSQSDWLVPEEARPSAGHDDSC